MADIKDIYASDASNTHTMYTIRRDNKLFYRVLNINYTLKNFFFAIWRTYNTKEVRGTSQQQQQKMKNGKHHTLRKVCPPMKNIASLLCRKKNIEDERAEEMKELEKWSRKKESFLTSFNIEHKFCLLLINYICQIFTHICEYCPYMISWCYIMVLIVLCGTQVSVECQIIIIQSNILALNIMYTQMDIA